MPATQRPSLGLRVSEELKVAPLEAKLLWRPIVAQGHRIVVGTNHGEFLRNMRTRRVCLGGGCYHDNDRDKRPPQYRD